MTKELDEVYELFPRLAERKSQFGGTMSGGEQQMIAIGRALMTNPRVLLLDEPSMGLAPILVQQIFDIITEINNRGTTVLLVEQNAQQALQLAHRAYVLETGRVVKSAEAVAAAGRPAGAGRLPGRRPRRRGRLVASRAAPIAQDAVAGTAWTEQAAPGMLTGPV